MNLVKMLPVLFVAAQVFLLTCSIVLVYNPIQTENAKLKERLRLEILVAHKKKEYLAAQEELRLLEDVEEDEELSQRGGDEDSYASEELESESEAMELPEDTPAAPTEPAEPTKKSLTNGQKEWFATVHAIQKQYKLSWRDALKKAGEERKAASAALAQSTVGPQSAQESEQGGSSMDRDDAPLVEANQTKGSPGPRKQALASPGPRKQALASPGPRKQARDFASWVAAKQLPPGTLFHTTIENITMELELLENNTLKSHLFQGIDPQLEGPSPNKLINTFHTYLLENGLTDKKPSRIYNCWNHLKAVGPKGVWCALNSTSWGLTWDGEKGVWC
jgi:hypothetical protein